MAETTDTLPGEIWKPIAGYEGRYEVSSLGRLKRIGPLRIAKSSQSRPQALGQERIWRGSKVNGYYKTCLGGTGGRLEYMHRLVCETFHGPAPEGKPHVAHFDGDKLNNRDDNLRWADWKDNRADGIRLGEIKRGEARHNSNLTAVQVQQIRSEVAAGPRGTMRQIAIRMGLAPSHIRDIVVRRIWKEI